MNQNHRAIVIGRKKVGESDLEIILFTESLGKIYCKAKNASKITSSRLGSLQLGNTIFVSLSNRRPFYISQSRTIYNFLQIAKSLTQTNLLFFILEVVNRVSPQEEKNQELFNHLEKSIQAIAKNQVGTFIHQELEIFTTLGYGIPTTILKYLEDKNFPLAQKSIQSHIETIIDKPLQSTKLFS